MTDKTDTLVALADSWEKGMGAAHRRICAVQLREALAAPAEGGQGEGVDLGEVIREKVREHGSYRAASKAIGVNYPYLCQMAHDPNRKPSKEILAALGLERVTVTRRLIDSAGGAKGEATIDLDRVFLDAYHEAMKANTWMPAEGGQGIRFRCPTCRAPETARERRPNGNSKCMGGHTYASKDAIDSADGAKDTEGEERARKLYEPDEYEDAFKGRTPQPAKGDEAVLEVVAKYVGKTSGIYRYIRDDLAKVTRPVATAQVPDDRVQYIIGKLRDHSAKADARRRSRSGGHGDGVPSHTAMLVSETVELIQKLAAAPASPKGGVVDEAMVSRALDARPFQNLAVRVWQLFTSQNDGEQIMRAALIAALATTPTGQGEG